MPSPPPLHPWAPCNRALAAATVRSLIRRRRAPRPLPAACYNKPAFDGSPITCYCPVYKAPKYLLGSPLGIKPSCGSTLPYVLSGAALYGSP